jgi:hypothetical protein
MVLLPRLIGNQLSSWMPPPNDDDDQPHKSRRDEPRDDPEILWAVELTDGRKAVLVGGWRLFIGRSVMDMRTLDGLSDIAKALLNLGINTFAEAKGRLPTKVVGAIVEIEETEEELRNPPRQVVLLNLGPQVPLFQVPVRVAS